MSKKKTNEKNKERIDESQMSASEVIAGWKKWYTIIKSLNLPIEVVEDDKALEAVLRERGYMK